ncbi:hypothetical protein BDB00DRAFT_839763 [Zychaea mexicana]|uniref:uncharacterized protein n=1 Tax=Zychaea mexicana TaxID=64656 RepID=UPI0022FE9B3E|nr:uncharacterized protein BDB00DRAFT_839763 [Zychaea mexicana]KAI9490010.1 hypothetical protein BDB00DRAFT_839763 [Zychaea mexicana]
MTATTNLESNNTISPSFPYAKLLSAKSVDTRIDDLSKHSLIVRNHETHDVFSDSAGHINHLSHHYLAAYSLGASMDKLQTIYDVYASYMRPRPPSIGVLTDKTYQQHLGNRDAYTSYLEYFTKEIEHRGMLDAIRFWMFHDNEKDNMLPRVLGSGIHPLIHLGYAVEFNLPLIAAESLSMAASSEDTLKHFFAAAAPPAVPNQQASATCSIKDIVAKVNCDPAFDGIVKFTDKIKVLSVLASAHKAGSKISEYVAQWSIKDLKSSLQELYTQVMLLYASTGIRGNSSQSPKIDFFLAHCLTSIHAAHTLLPYLTPLQAEWLLRGHLATTLVCYIGCGRPQVQPESLVKYEGTNIKSLTSLSAVPDASDDDTSKTKWHEVIKRSLAPEIQEPHYIKVVRALALGQVVFDDPPSLKDVWLKAAQLTMDVAERSAGEISGWDFAGIGFDETWQ